jgi:phage terminase large subunit
MKSLDIALYKHIYLGHCLDDGTNKFFKNVNFSSHRIKEYKRIYIGFDVADDGSDPHAITIETDNIVIDIQEIYGSYEKGITTLINIINRLLPMRKEIIVIYDSIGVGAGVGHSLKDFKQIKVIPFKASNAVIKPNRKEILPYTNKEAYYNLKAQIWHIMGYNTKEIKYQEVKLIDKLIEQLETPLITYSSNKILVEKKKDLLKRGVPSPNLADSYICILYAKYLEMY